MKSSASSPKFSNLDMHIEMTPGVAGGKARIAGRRITVHNIVVWHEQMGMSPDEISAEHDLSLAEIHAALAYYFDHRLEIDRDQKKSAAFIEELRRKTPSKLFQKLQLRATA